MTDDPQSVQHPVHSPFGPASTATDVLDGVELSGRLVLMTGGYSGIGLEATRALTASTWPTRLR